MALSDPQTIFGVHTVTPYNITTGLPMGIARVLGSVELSSEGEIISLAGGSSKYSWKNERGLISAEISLTLREYPPFLFEALLGKSVTSNAAETAGNASTLTNKNGTSVVAATGVATASVKAGSEADLKFTGFIVKAVTSTTVDVYATTNLDFNQGTATTFGGDLLKITASPLTITASTAVTVPDYGVELTGGGGVIAMVADDSATFDTRPINTGSENVVIGSTSEVFTNFGLIVTASRPGDAEMTLIDCYNVAGSGLPINFTENAFSEASVTLTMARDTARNGVYELTRVKSTN